MGISRKRLIKMVQESKNRKAYSDAIAVGDSDLYDYEVTRRAVLREIAFMEQQDEDKKTPEDSPFAGDYVGWCWASQRFLANRAGTTDDYVHECVKLFEKDGVIEVREWTDTMGYPHTEYRIIREKVDAHKRPDGFMKIERKKPRQGGSKKANAGSFKAGNTAAAKKILPSSHPLPTEFAPFANSVGSRMPTEFASVVPTELTPVSETGANPSKGVEHIGSSSVASLLEGFDSGCTSTGSDEASSLPPSAVETSEADVLSLFDQEESQNQSGLATKPKGKITKGERVLLNKHTYVDLYEEYKARVAAGGSQALPQCRRCKATIHFNEPAHVCPGYQPQYDTKSDERREHEEVMRDESYKRKRKPRGKDCPRCGETTYSVEEAQHHEEFECPAIN
jgi:hypothetical protein